MYPEHCDRRGVFALVGALCPFTGTYALASTRYRYSVRQTPSWLLDRAFVFKGISFEGIPGPGGVWPRLLPG